MSRDIVHVRSNKRLTALTKDSAAFTGLAEDIGGDVVDRMDGQVLTNTPAPTGLTLTTGTTYNAVWIKAEWNAVADTNVRSYEVTFDRGGVASTVQRVETTEAYFEPALGGATYTITVGNVYVTGAVGSNTVSDSIVAAADSTVPAIPTGLSIGTGFESITISWDENTEPDMEFGLGQYRCQLSNDGTFAGGDIIRDKKVGALVTTFADLATNTQYWARVAAVDTSGNESSFSASVNATTGQIQGTDIADLAVTNIKIDNATIESGKIVDLEVNKLIAGSGFINALTVASGGSIESDNFVTGPSGFGWKIDNTGAEFNNVTVRGTVDGVNGDFGTITGGQLEINWSTSAGVRITSGGAVDIGGTDTTSAHFDSAGNMWWGNAGSYAAATRKISNAGVATFTSGSFSGAITATSGAFTGDLTVSGWLTCSGAKGMRTTSGVDRIEISDTDDSIKIYDGGVLSGEILASGQTNPVFTSRNNKNIGIKSAGSGEVVIEATDTGKILLQAKGVSTQRQIMTGEQLTGDLMRCDFPHAQLYAPSLGNSTTANDNVVYNNADGRLYEKTSGAQYKQNMSRWDLLNGLKTLPTIGHRFQAKPEFRLETEPEGTWHVGTVAQHVAQHVGPEFVTLKDGEPHGVIDSTLLIALWDYVAVNVADLIQRVEALEV